VVFIIGKVVSSFLILLYVKLSYQLVILILLLAVISVLAKLISTLPKILSGPLFKTMFQLSLLLAPIVRFINLSQLLLQVFSIIFLLILSLGCKSGLPFFNKFVL
jgi:hypothetical protein